MDYIIRFFCAHPKSITNENTKDTNEDIKFVKQIDIRYENEINVINTFLNKHTSNTYANICFKGSFKPGGGGCHDINDDRVKKLYNDAVTTSIKREFLHEIDENFQEILNKQTHLDYDIAKKLLMTYLCDKSSCDKSPMNDNKLPINEVVNVCKSKKSHKRKNCK